MQASKVNKSVSECSKTGLCIKYLNVTGVQFFRLQIWIEISHSLGLKKSTANQIRWNETVVPRLYAQFAPRENIHTGYKLAPGCILVMQTVF